LGENERGKCGLGERVDEYLGRRAMNFSTGEEWRVKGVRFGMIR
jgi:hypothetical protein